MSPVLASEWWAIPLAVVGGLVLVWLALALVLYVAGRRTGEPLTLREAFLLLPDVVVLLRRLASDPELPRRVRWRLVLLLGYLALPFDLVPDFIPVAGYADDVLVVAVVLRSVVRAAGPDALERHWTGEARGLATIRWLAGAG